MGKKLSFKDLVEGVLFYIMPLTSISSSSLSLLTKTKETPTGLNAKFSDGRLTYVSPDTKVVEKS